MTRYSVYTGRYRPDAYIQDIATYEQRLVEMRNRFRTALDPSNNGNIYRVSDIIKWPGLSSASGYAFLIQQRDGAGAPTGKEWLIMLPGLNGSLASFASFGFIFGNNNTGNIGNFFYTTFGDNTSFSFNAGWGLHFNSKAAYTMDLQASANTGSPTASEALQVQGDASRTGTLNTIVAADNWQVTQTAGAKFKPGDILVGQTSGATFTVSAINNDNFYDFGFTNQSTLALSSGDFTAPGSNPYSAHTTFMPSDVVPHGVALRYLMEATGNPNWHLFIFDDQKPFMAMYMTLGRGNSIATAVCMGDIIDTAKGAGNDDFKEAMYSINTRVDVDEAGAITSPVLSALYGDHPDGNGGGRALFTPNAFANFTISNSPRESDGKYPVEPVLIDNANEFKGSFDPEIIANVGAFNEDYQKVFNTAGGPIIKIAQNLCFPWRATEPLFPPLRWDLEPDDSLLSE